MKGENKKGVLEILKAYQEKPSETELEVALSISITTSLAVIADCMESLAVIADCMEERRSKNES